MSNTAPAPRASAATVAARVAAWRAKHDTVATTTTGLVAAAARGVELPRNNREALAALPTRRWK